MYYLVREIYWNFYSGDSPCFIWGVWAVSWSKPSCKWQFHNDFIHSEITVTYSDFIYFWCQLLLSPRGVEQAFILSGALTPLLMMTIQGLANILCKGPNSKYFRVCWGSVISCHSYSSLLLFLFCFLPFFFF